MKIGVLALQGAFLEHEQALNKLGAKWTEIRALSDLTDDIDGIILPGGESTVQGKLLFEEGLFEPLREKICAGLPVFGTCAGMILLAKSIANDENVWLGTSSVTVRRNAYGRQLGSFRAELEMKGVGKYPAVFIRAPYAEDAGKGEALAVWDGKIVAVREKNMLMTAFHPELTSDLRVHEYFLKMI